MFWMRRTPCEYDFSDKMSKEGVSLYWESWDRAIDITERMFTKIINNKTLQIIAKHLPKNLIDIYFKKKILEEIHPYIAKLHVMEWQLEHGTIHGSRGVKWFGNREIGILLKDEWPNTEIPLAISPS